MKAFSIMVTALLITGCDSPKNDDVLERLPYWKWAHYESKDEITDIKSSSAVLKSGPVMDGNTSPVEMHFRCLDGKFDFYLSWNRYVEDDPLVDTRIDNDAHQSSKWEVSTDRKSTFNLLTTSVFLDRLAASKTYLARVSTATGNITAKFDTSQVRKETKSIREECKI